MEEIGYSITQADLEDFSKAFHDDPKNRLAMNACTSNGHLNVATSYEAVRNLNRSDFSTRVADEGNPVTSQKATGRCWLFAALNVLRVPFQNKLKIKEFEFSQAFLFFYDKFERVNYVLTQVIETANLPIDDRLLACMLKTPCEDGGQFDMIVNIVNKYGLCPKSIFPDVKCCENSRQLKRIGNRKVREWAMKLRESKDKGGNSIAMLKGFMKEWWKILCIHVGTPPQTFDFHWTDTDKKFSQMLNITPIEFRDFVNKTTGTDISTYKSLIHDPRSPYDMPYTVDRLNNMVDTNLLYLNIKIAQMKELTIKALQDGLPVWFGCDYSPYNHRQLGILDQGIFDHEAMCDLTFEQDKVQRLRYYESCMTHAMVFTGVDLAEDGTPLRWRVENSHGKDRGLNGYITMSDKWFSEYVFQVALPESRLPENILNAQKEKVTVYPRWDPMGTLAQ